jgi:hypothetical protein
VSGAVPYLGVAKKVSRLPDVDAEFTGESGYEMLPKAEPIESSSADRKPTIQFIGKS